MSHHEQEDLEVEAEDTTKDEVAEDWEKGIPPFVRKLTKMVAENPGAIDWTSGGSFLVKDIDSFSSGLLPKYFKSIKFCSFVRQLNMYNFHKVEDLPHSNNKSMEFSNPYFLPGRRDLLKKIHRRKTVKRSKEEDEEEKPQSRQAENAVQQQQQQQQQPQQTPSGYTIDENSYKGLLHAVLKLQQQTDANARQMAQVLAELSYFKKSHYELEQKIQQLTLQQNSLQHNANDSIYTVNASGAIETHTNASFNLFANPPTDLTTFLFSDTELGNISNSNGNNPRGGLLTLINDEKLPSFEFNGVQQQLGEADVSTSPNNQPILYETTQYDVFA